MVCPWKLMWAGGLAVLLSVVSVDFLAAQEARQVYLGARVGAPPGLPTDPSGPSSPGAVVAEVVADSPAAEAGMQVGDVIVQFGGREVSSPGDLHNLVRLGRVGGRYAARVQRQGQSLTLYVTLRAMPTDATASQASAAVDPPPAGKTFQIREGSVVISPGRASRDKYTVRWDVSGDERAIRNYEVSLIAIHPERPTLFGKSYFKATVPPGTRQVSGTLQAPLGSDVYYLAPLVVAVPLDAPKASTPHERLGLAIAVFPGVTPEAAAIPLVLRDTYTYLPRGQGGRSSLSTAQVAFADARPDGEARAVWTASRIESHNALLFDEGKLARNVGVRPDVDDAQTTVSFVVPSVASKRVRVLAHVGLLGRTRQPTTVDVEMKCVAHPLEISRAQRLTPTATEGTRPVEYVERVSFAAAEFGSPMPMKLLERTMDLSRVAGQADACRLEIEFSLVGEKVDPAHPPVLFGVRCLGAGPAPPAPPPLPTPPPQLADLTVEPISTSGGAQWMTPYPPDAGKLAEVSVVVKNAGAVAVGEPFSADFFVDGKLKETWSFPAKESIEDPQDVDSLLEPGETRVWTTHVTLPAGTHALRWVVDAKNEIQETDETTNNSLEQKVDCGGPDSLPDLIVEDIWHEGQLLVGEKQTWKVQIKNQGQAPAVGPILTILEADGVQFASFSCQQLAKNASATFDISQYAVVKPGSESIVGIVDASNVVNEGLYEFNNSLKKSFSVQSVDLEAADLAVTQTSTGASLTVTVRNNGEVDADKPFKVYLWPGTFNPPKAVSSLLLTCPPLKAKDSKKLTHLAALPIVDFKARVEVDYPDPKKVYREPPDLLANNVLVRDVAARRVFLIIIDGLRPDKLKTYLTQQMYFIKNSGFREIGIGGPDADVNKIEVQDAKTVFPSITICANASIITGLYPAHHGITGNTFYKRDKKQFLDYETKQWAPTFYGFWDEFGTEDHYNALLGGRQRPFAGQSGPDKDLAELGVKTVYDYLRQYDCPSHVVFHFYSKGAGRKPTPQLAAQSWLNDGWDPPGKEALIWTATIGKNDHEEFFKQYEKQAALKAKQFVENASQHVTFPRLFTLYFASVDHSCHCLGISNPSFAIPDVQAEYLGKIDIELYHVIKAYKQHFPAEFDSTVFIITSDHGQKPVDPYKFVSTKDLWSDSMLLGPWQVDDYSPYAPTSAGPGRIVVANGILRLAYIAGNGPMKHVYVTANNRKELILALLGNLCYQQKQIAGSQPDKDRPILMVLGRLPGGKYQQFKVAKKNAWQGPVVDVSGTAPSIGEPYVLVSEPLPKEVAYIDPMLNSDERSGDILILANQKQKWQFAENKPQAMGISIPLILDKMRIPFSESYNSSSTHGSVDTMDVPLMFVGKPIPNDATIPWGNVVDIVPTILNMLGLPIPTPMDGKPLLNHELKPTIQIAKEMLP